jgi:large subunit ribosomal protein L24
VNKIKRDDTVVVTKGKDRGRSGQVRKVIPPGKKTDEYGNPRPGRVIVTGVNFVKRHMRPRGPQRPGGIVDREAPLPWANVAILCATCNKPVRVGFRDLADGRKVRYCKNCDASVD